MSVPRDIQELVEVLQLAGWSKIDEANLIYEIFYAQDYPEHDSGNYETYNELFDNIMSDLDVQEVESGEETEKRSNIGYGIIRVKGFYYKASWGVDTSKIKDSIVQVEPVTKVTIVYEEV